MATTKSTSDSGAVGRRRFLAAAAALGGATALSKAPCRAEKRDTPDTPKPMDTYTDSVTGARVTMLTPGPERDQVVYQTHPMWTPDMGHLVVESYRSGDARLPHALNRADGAVTCLAPDGAQDWTLARKDNRLFYRNGDELFAAFVGETRPAQQVGRFEGIGAIKPISMSIDADEQIVYVGVTLEPDRRWGLAALDIDSASWRLFSEVDFRVGHIQANPFVPGLVLFCHETGGDAPQRMWVVDAAGGAPRPFYKETYEEWVTHEVWWGPDRAIFTVWPYDDEHKRLPHGVVSADLGSGTPTVHAQFPAWHTHGSPDGRWAVADDFDRSLWLIEVATGERRLLTQGHRANDINTHPHPSFTPDGKAVVFSSSRNGTEDVFLVEIPAWGSLPKPPDA